MPEMPDADTAAKRLRFDRVRLLSEELDRLTVDSAERTTSVSTKASFLAVSAGVLIAAVTAQTWTIVPVFAVAALALACVGLGCAAVALRPGKRISVQARRLVDRHLDCQHSAAQVEEELVRDKADVLTAHDRDNRARGQWVWVGFGAVAIAAVALALVFSFQMLGG